MSNAIILKYTSLTAIQCTTLYLSLQPPYGVSLDKFLRVIPDAVDHL